MALVNQEYLQAIELTQRLMSQNQAEREEAWNFIWSKRTYRRWTKILMLVVNVLVQTYGNRGADVAKRWVRRLAQQRTTPEGDPGYLGLALAIRSMHDITEALPWKEVDGPAVEQEVVAFWVHELHKTAWYGILEQPVPLARLAHSVKDLSTSAAQFAVALLLDILFEEGTRNIHQTLLYALDALQAYAPGERVNSALQSENRAIHRAAEHLLSLREQQSSAKTSMAENDTHVGHVHHPEVQVHDDQEEQVYLDEFVHILSSFHQPIYQQVRHTLMARKDDIPLDLLLELLHVPHEYVRATAVQLLGRKGKNAPISALLPLLNDPARRVQEAVMQTLRSLGEDAVGETTAFIYHDTPALVRVAAAQLLGPWKRMLLSMRCWQPAKRVTGVFARQQ